jgi:hypothetical protein
MKQKCYRDVWYDDNSGGGGGFSNGGDNDDDNDNYNIPHETYKNLQEINEC